ncbi:MAG TPA: sodium/substrate symporter small subunit [Candidatus Limnocylindrales bacterium]|nr:sodium/substrate symporter small subunit [Candidatus Limnocylindrales bacterium]
MEQVREQVRKENVEAYMKANRRLVFTLVGVWALMTWGTALLGNVLNNIVIGGAGLGMILMHQTVMVVYVAMIFYYAAKTEKMEAHYGLTED